MPRYMSGRRRFLLSLLRCWFFGFRGLVGCFGALEGFQAFCRFAIFIRPKQAFHRRLGFLWGGRFLIGGEDVGSGWRRASAASHGFILGAILLGGQLGCTSLFFHLLGRSFGVDDYFVRFFFRNAGKLSELRRLNKRQIIVREKPFFDKGFNLLIGDARNCAEPAFGSFDAFVKFLVGHDLDVPTHEFGGKTNVLATAADGER